MDALAHELLTKLFEAGEKAVAGRRSRQASLTETALARYRRTTSLAKKDAFEHAVVSAESAGAVAFVRDADYFIRRIDLANLHALGNFLGLGTTSDKVSIARAVLLSHMFRYPVLEEVLVTWSGLRRVRGLDPEDHVEWLDAIRVIEACDEPSDQPVREFSALLFRDSKRIERLIGPLDVLLAGSLESEARGEREVLQELGLYREEHPVLMAGQVEVRRERVTSLLDIPYSGFPAKTVHGFASQPLEVLTIENLTTFHTVAKRHSKDNMLLLYTAGMPSPSWRQMYRRLLESLDAAAIVRHWGDIDEGGFRIASVLAREAKAAGHILQPYRMSPEDIPVTMRREASAHTLKRMRHFAAESGWEALGIAIEAHGFKVEQEALR